MPVSYLLTKFLLDWSTLLLLKQTWVPLPVHSKANLLTPGRGEGKCSIYCKAPDNESRAASVQNIPTPPVGFRETSL